MSIENKQLSTNMTRLEYYKRRYRRAYSIYTQWISLLQACYHYCIPYRDLYYYTNQLQGTQKNAKVYDTTGVAATNNFVSKIQMALTPPQQNWAFLDAGVDIDENDKKEVNELLQAETEKLFSYIRVSNFDLAINECYYDLAVGTAVLCINEGETDEMPLKFYSIPLSRVCFEESINGYIESAYRFWEETKISEIKIMWPQAELPGWMETMLETDPNATTKNLYEGVIYMHGERNPYKYVLWVDSDILLEQELPISPWIIFRWSKINNETYGRGPIQNALPSLLSLNELFRIELVTANLNCAKPIMAFSDGVFNPWTFALQPNSIIPIAPNGTGVYPLQPMPDTANPQFLQLTAQDLRIQINKLMYADPLEPIRDKPTRTATELTIRQNNLAQEIGPAFTRLQQEFLSPTIKQCIYILQKRGLMNPLVINGREIQLNYKSPLVLEQNQQDVKNLVTFYQVLQSFVGEEAVIYLKPEKIHLWLADKMHADNSLLNSEEEMKGLLEQKATQMQEVEQAEIGGMYNELGTNEPNFAAG